MQEIEARIKILKTSTYQEQQAKEFAQLLKGISYEELFKIVNTHKLVSFIAQDFTRHSEWRTSTPTWIYDLIHVIYKNPAAGMPIDQTKELVRVVLMNLSNCDNNSTSFDILQLIFLTGCGTHFLKDANLLKTLKQILTNSAKPTKLRALEILCTLTDGNAEWQLKMLHERKMIDELIPLYRVFAGEFDYWGFLFNIAQHEDAKTLLPAQIAEIALAGTHDLCQDLYAILCNENTASTLIIDKKYVENKVRMIKNLLDSKHNVGKPIPRNENYNLGDLLLPLVNLSIGDGNKMMLGEAGIVELLLEILQIDENSNLIAAVSANLRRSKFQASEALLHLIMQNEKNCSKLMALDAEQTFASICAQVPDSMYRVNEFKKNISGILAMCTKSGPAPLRQSTKQKHIMISYSWKYQPTVRRIVKELQERGFNLWVDEQHMQGGIYDAMASAVEGAELIILCASQSYYDSANCKMECMYAKTKHVDIIPLIMQPGFALSGWLGFVLAGLLYYEFHDEGKFPTSMQALIKEIENIRRRSAQNNLPNHVTPAAATNNNNINDNNSVQNATTLISTIVANNTSTVYKKTFTSTLRVFEKKLGQLEDLLDQTENPAEIAEIAKAIKECVLVISLINQ